MCHAGLLIEQLTKGTYECMICCNVVKRETAVWHCSNCYHIYHLYCIKRWANSSTLNADSSSDGWRCPACQNATTAFPNIYLCFCGMFFGSVYFSWKLNLLSWITKAGILVWDWHQICFVAYSVAWFHSTNTILRPTLRSGRQPNLVLVYYFYFVL